MKFMVLCRLFSTIMIIFVMHSILTASVPTQLCNLMNFIVQIVEHEKNYILAEIRWVYTRSFR